MEIEYFIAPSAEGSALRWIDTCTDWLVSIGLPAGITEDIHPEDKLALLPGHNRPDVSILHGEQELKVSPADPLRS